MTKRLPIHHVVVGTDFGEASVGAVALAADIASLFAARLTLVHVVEDYVSTYPVGDLFVPADLIVDIERASQEELDRVLASVADRAPLVDGLLRRGRPAVELVAHARESGCDLLVVGTHGHRGPARWLLGSVAEKVLRTSPAPVLTVRHHAVEMGAERGRRVGQPARIPSGAVTARTFR